MDICKKEGRHNFYIERGRDFISEKLKEVGLYPNINGYGYIINAVGILVQYGKMNLIKVYAHMEKEHHINKNSIASSINYIIKKTYYKHCKQTYDELGFNEHRPPTVKELIFILYEKVVIYLSYLEKENETL